MRIAYVLEKFPSPTEYFILNEILQLEKAGVEIVVFVLKKQSQYEHIPQFKKLKSTITYLPRFYFYFPISIILQPLLFLYFQSKYNRKNNIAFSFLRILKLMRCYGIAQYLVQKKIKCEHIHAHFAFISSDVAYCLSKLLKTPYSFTAHAQDIYANEGKIKKHMALAKFVITCTEYNKKHLNDITDHAYTDKIHKVYHGIDIDNWPRKIKKTNFPEDGVRILTVARLVEKKGLIYLLRAINLLVREGINVDCKLIGEGELKTILMEYINLHNLHKNIQILPFVSQNIVLEYYKQSDVFVLPCIVAKNGDRDGLPNVILEAMLNRVPVISTKVSAIPEVLKHNETGILVKVKNEESIAEAIKLLMNNYDLRKTIIGNARKEIKDNFDLEFCTSQLKNIFNKYKK